MRRIDAASDLQDGIEPAPGPAPQADGLPGFSPRPSKLPPRPRLCAAGPCRHYHRLEMQVEAQDPGAVRVPVRLPVLPVGAQAVDDGTLYQAPATFHTSTSHYCYPDSGIEIVLGDTPVVSCNRWSPADTANDDVRWKFLQTGLGRRYQASVEEWEQARAKETRDAQDAETLIADSLIAAQMELYAFDAYEGMGGKWVGFWNGVSAGVYANTRTGAIEMALDAAEEKLRKMYHDGIPFPEPKESK